MFYVVFRTCILLLIICTYVSFIGLITSVGEERADFSVIDYWFLHEGFPLPLDAWEGCLISSWHSLDLPHTKFDQIEAMPIDSTHYAFLVAFNVCFTTHLLISSHFQ